jgi:hypothetical protein
MKREKDLDGSGEAPTPSAARSEIQFREFNLNCWIRVKLNDAGYKHQAESYNNLMARFGETKTAEDFKAKADAEGYSKFQAWCFIQEFGPLTRLGAILPYETTIRFQEEDLIPLPAAQRRGEASAEPPQEGPQ